MSIEIALLLCMAAVGVTWTLALLTTTAIGEFRRRQRLAVVARRLEQAFTSTTPLPTGRHRREASHA